MPDEAAQESYKLAHAKREYDRRVHAALTLVERVSHPALLRLLEDEELMAQAQSQIAALCREAKVRWRKRGSPVPRR